MRLCYLLHVLIIITYVHIPLSNTHTLKQKFTLKICLLILYGTIYAKIGIKAINKPSYLAKIPISVKNY